MNQTTQTLREALDELPLCDIHTHLGERGWQAETLADLIAYHWLSIELSRAAGTIITPFFQCDPTEYVRKALPWFPSIRNTANHYAFMGMLRDLYGIKARTLTPENWQAIDARVRERAADPGWFDKVLARCKVRRAAVQPLPGCPAWQGERIPYAYAEPAYALCDATLAGKLMGEDPELWGVETYRQALAGRVETWVADGVRALHVWPRETWVYRPDTSDHQAASSFTQLVRGESLAPAERDSLQSWCADRTAEAAGAQGMTIQLFHGSRQYADSSSISRTSGWNPAFLPSWAHHLHAHEGTQFDLFLATRLPSHEAAMLARLHCNLAVSGAWWHAFTPTSLSTFFRDRFEVLPHTVWNAFYSDGYHVEWIYAKQLVTKNRLAVALGSMVEEGFVSLEDAIGMARHTLYDNAVKMYGGQKRLHHDPRGSSPEGNPQ